MENTGKIARVENAGVENAGVDSRSGKCRNSLAVYIHTNRFIKESQHKHAGFKTKHNAQSISQ